jgi:hypothetical protein
MKRHWKILLLVCPLMALSPVDAVTFSEDFAVNPAADGWKIFGDTNLFQWNPTNQNLEVTWDSSQTNSYFCHSIGTILTSNDAFSLQFDLRLDDVTVGGYGFELAVGFLNFADATRASFFRGTGRDSPNLVEFDYFPDAGFGPSLDVTLVDQTRTNFHFFYDVQPLDAGVTHHIILTHAAGTATITAQIFANGSFYTALPFSYFTANFLDFRVDTIAIESYSDAYSGGSILAHGIADNLVVTVPPPPIQDFTGNFTNGIWQAQFISQSNWLYTIERTADLQSWMSVATTSGNATNLFLQDINPPANKAFYRVRAERP